MKNGQKNKLVDPTVKKIYERGKVLKEEGCSGNQEGQATSPMHQCVQGVYSTVQKIRLKMKIILKTC